MKILNLYAGIGGNRKLWEGHDITAVENVPEIAAVYQDFFPNDTVVVADAHKYLLDHFGEYDFIWSSPPCPTHSKIGRMRMLNNDVKTGSHKTPVRYPDIRLYQEIILLNHFFDGKWLVENVIGYYEPLIKPQTFQRHHFWANFYIPPMRLPADNIDKGNRKQWEEALGFDLTGYGGFRKDTVLRNCVHPHLGAHILRAAQENSEPTKQLDL